MKLRTIEEAKNEYKEGWDPELNTQRIKLLEKYPFSTVIETDFLEYDSAIKWCESNIGEKEKKWDELFFDKIGYDYGYFEFFFLDEEKNKEFGAMVPKFYAETVTGKWRTDGLDNIIHLN